jgi:nitrate reductase gamma subunit
MSELTSQMTNRVAGEAGNELLFRVTPYLALGMFAAGLILRYALAREGIEEARSRFAEARAAYRRGRVPGVRLLLGGLALILAGHLAGLLAPEKVAAWNADPRRLYLLEGAGALLALVALAGWTTTIWRHVRWAKGGWVVEVADSVLLALVFVSVASGLLVAVLYRWGSVWGTATLAPYVRSIAGGEPLTALVTATPFLVRLHVFSAMALVAVFPFTRLALPLVLAAHHTLALASRPVAGLGGAIEARLARLDLGGWLWPEPEYRWSGRAARGEAGRGGESRRPPPRP